MKYFARIMFLLDENYGFTDVCSTRRLLFSFGKAKCDVYSEKDYNMQHIVMEYGPFDDKESATKNGINLLRCTKIHMANCGMPARFSGGGTADSSAIEVYYDGVSKWDKLTEQQTRGCTIRPAVVNSYTGLTVYDVHSDLGELRFSSTSLRTQALQSLSLGIKKLQHWNKYMDLSLSLVTSSVGLGDNRVAFLLRVMAIEALVSEPRLRDSEELEAINIVLHNLNKMELTKSQIEFITQILSDKRLMGTRKKIRTLLDCYLQGKTYCGKSAAVFFSDCYSTRSSLTHNGSASGIKAEIVEELKKLCLDLLLAMSEQTANSGNTSDRSKKE